MYYCIGYTSNNDWSICEIPLDQYQEKLQERWDELPSGKEIMRLKQQLKEREEELQEETRMKTQHELLVKAREDELQRLIKEKKQLQEDHHQLLLRDKEQQERESNSYKPIKQHLLYNYRKPTLSFNKQRNIKKNYTKS